VERKALTIVAWAGKNWGEIPAVKDRPELVIVRGGRNTKGRVSNSQLWAQREEKEKSSGEKGKGTNGRGELQRKKLAGGEQKPRLGGGTHQIIDFEQWRN